MRYREMQSTEVCNGYGLVRASHRGDMQSC